MHDFGPKIAFFLPIRGKMSKSAQIERGREDYYEDKYLRKPKPVKVSL